MEAQFKQQKPILHNSIGSPYIALFDDKALPIKNTLTGIPLGAYVTNFTYKYDEEEENLCTIVLDTGDPDTVDMEPLEEGSTIFIQWGYIFPDGSSVASPEITIKIRDSNVVFDSTGTHVTLVCVDSTNYLRFMPPFRVSDTEKLTDYLDKGCEDNVGVIIERFN